MEIVDIATVADNTTVKTGVDSNVNSNALILVSCGVTPRVGCSEDLCSNVGSGQDGEVLLLSQQPLQCQLFPRLLLW
ncbi:hypothetical protein KSS87_019464 [Heliosperma pusillum]|nr:hypothetical protein KSS87_019464 [Heliosperma pusillum]